MVYIFKGIGSATMFVVYILGLSDEPHKVGRASRNNTESIRRELEEEKENIRVVCIQYIYVFSMTQLYKATGEQCHLREYK